MTHDAASDPNTVFHSLRAILKKPSVTLNILIDHLRSCDVIHVPKHQSMAFRWSIVVEDKSQLSEIRNDENILFLCEGDLAREFVEAINVKTTSALIVFLDEPTIPKWLNKSPWLKRSIVIKKTQDISVYSSLISNLFLAMHVWESEMDRIAYTEGTQNNRAALPSAIYAGASFLEGFVCVTDTGFNLIKYSEEIAPPNETYQYLVEKGCYDDKEIENIKKNVLEKASHKKPIVICGPSENNPNTTLHAPLYIDNSYVFHFTFSVPKDRSVEAMTDLFEKFIKRAKSICLEFWRRRIEIESPCHKALIGLINKRKMSRQYLHTQFSQTTIPTTSFFRLLCYSIDPNTSLKKNQMIAKTIGTLNDGHCYPFTYEDNILVLCCSPTNTHRSISLNKIAKSAETIMYEPFGMAASASQIFSDIKDIDFAYRQTKIAMMMKRPFLAAYPGGYGAKNGIPVVPFDFVLQFYILNETPDPDLVNFSFRNNIADTLLEEEAEGSDVRLSDLLWDYLSTNSNASETAKRMNIHRNTVIYHVKKFEKRFDVSLESPIVRHRLILDFSRSFSRNAR